MPKQKQVLQHLHTKSETYTSEYKRSNSWTRQVELRGDFITSAGISVGIVICLNLADLYEYCPESLHYAVSLVLSLCVPLSHIASYHWHVRWVRNLSIKDLNVVFRKTLLDLLCSDWYRLLVSGFVWRCWNTWFSFANVGAQKHMSYCDTEDKTYFSFDGAFLCNF